MCTHLRSSSVPHLAPGAFTGNRPADRHQRGRAANEHQPHRHSADTADTKKAFREAVLKAAQEFKDERKLEVESKEQDEFETTESTEISNPNDELTVTYLFYELQRRFKISEHLHRLTPVVLVAMEVLNPSRRSIDQVLLTHSWIISRVLLDDRYRPALTYLTTAFVGDELALREQLKTVEKLRAVVDALQRDHAALLSEVKIRNAQLEYSMNVRAKGIDTNAEEGLWGTSEDFVVGQGADEDLDALRVREENAKAFYERALRAEQEMQQTLRSEMATLNQATADYARLLSTHASRLLEIASLRVHFKANVLYYMQAIWAHTFKDQLYFSVHRLQAPAMQETTPTYDVELVTNPPTHVVPRPGHRVFKVTATPDLRIDESSGKTLAELADLDNPLGFKGNYTIFPLRKSNALIDHMMTPCVDAEFGIHDPDELGNWTPEDFVEHAKSLHATLPQQDFTQVLPHLQDQFRRLISAPRCSGEEVVVPSSSLYTEALPGKHPNLEDFKLRHREVDVQKAGAEVRRLELENLR
jgi:hypothetical protein